MLLDPLIALTLWKIVLQTNCFSSKVKEILIRFIWWNPASATVQVRLSSPTMMPCLPTWWGHTQNGFLTLFTPAGGISLQPMKNLRVNHFSPLSKLHFNYTKTLNIKSFPTIGHTGGDEYRHCQVDWPGVQRSQLCRFRHCQSVQWVRKGRWNAIYGC